MSEYAEHRLQVDRVIRAVTPNLPSWAISRPDAVRNIDEIIQDRIQGLAESERLHRTRVDLWGVDDQKMIARIWEERKALERSLSNARALRETISKDFYPDQYTNIDNLTVTVGEDNTEGLVTTWVDSGLAMMVDAFLQDTRRGPVSEVARNYADVGRGAFTFQHGYGDDTVDMDLLGGNGDGRTVAAYRAYAESVEPLRVLLWAMVGRWREDAAIFRTIGDSGSLGQATTLEAVADQIQDALTTTRD